MTLFQVEIEEVFFFRSASFSSDTFYADNTELSEDFFVNDKESGSEKAFYGFIIAPMINQSVS